MTEKKQDKEQPLLPLGVERIRTLFLETIKPIAEDLNAEEVLFFVGKSFDLGIEVLTLRGEGIQTGAVMVQYQIQQMQTEQLRAQTHKAGSTQAQTAQTEDEDRDISAGLYL